MRNIQDNDVLTLIKPYLKDKKAYIVGGFLRDFFMDKKSPDIDILICDCDVKEFSRQLADKINAHFIELDNENSIYRVVLEDKINYLDITKPVDDDFEKDIKRRDLTINAVAYDVNQDKIIDLTGGIKDIENKIIKGISDKNFEDDPLRLLRIYRFCAKTGFKISPRLIELTKNMAPLIHKSAKERINTELMKMFEGDYTDTALIKMYESGLLTEILPIYNEVKKIPKNSHHHLDLIHHLIETVRQLQILYTNSNAKVKEHLDNLNFGSIKQIAFLKFAGFLHDIGKPSCWTIEENTGRHRFLMHDEAGANLCVPILRDLKFSKKQIEYIKTVIKYHMYASGMVSSPDVNEKAYMRFYRKMEGMVVDIIFISMADRLSALGPMVTKDMVEENINALKNLLNNYFIKLEELKPLPKLIDGCEIMEILKIPQSPKLGEIIKAIKEAQISGDVTTKQDAIDFLKKIK